MRNRGASSILCIGGLVRLIEDRRASQQEAEVNAPVIGLVLFTPAKSNLLMWFLP